MPKSQSTSIRLLLVQWRLVVHHGHLPEPDCVLCVQQIVIWCAGVKWCITGVVRYGAVHSASTRAPPVISRHVPQPMLEHQISAGRAAWYEYCWPELSSGSTRIQVDKHTT